MFVNRMFLFRTFPEVNWDLCSKIDHADTTAAHNPGEIKCLKGYSWRGSGRDTGSNWLHQPQN